MEFEDTSSRILGSSSLSLGFFIYELRIIIPTHSVTGNCSEESMRQCGGSTSTLHK